MRSSALLDTSNARLIECFLLYRDKPFHVCDIIRGNFVGQLLEVDAHQVTMLNQSAADAVLQIKGFLQDLVFNILVDLDLVGLSNLDHA